ncbi:sulfite exporter protein [Cystoisospora suis]|uniref:Sulfite exporter protein n=1 Tax=Cystoisospora suis TaxID=483139 RepID=A0A2C6KMT0_9APIC|nr:sulfite exporter protein [Cystoisospora suis]
MRPLAFSASLRHGPFVRVVSALVPVFLLCPGQGVQASWPPDSPALSLRTQLMVPPATASQRELGSVHGGGSGAHHRIPLSLLGEERSVDYRPEHQAESGGGLVATLSGTPPGEKESSSVPLGRKFTRADTAAEDRQPRTGIQFPRTLAERLQGHAAPGVASWANSLETAGAAELSAKPKLSLGVAKADVFRLSHLHSGLRAVSTLRNPVPVSPRREDFSVHGGRGEVNLLNEGTPFASQQPSPVHISTDSTTEGAGTTFRRRMQDLTSTPGTLNPSAYIDGHLPFHASVLPAVATSYRRYSSSPYFSYQDTTPAVPGPNTPLPLSLFDTKPTKKPTPPLPSGPVAPAEPGFNSEKAESQQVWVVRSSDDSRPSGSFSLVSSVTTPAVPPLPSASPLQPSSLTPAFGSIPESSRPLPNLSSSASQTNREGEGEATTEEAASSDRHQASLARRPAVLPSTSFFNVLFLLLGLFMFAVLAASGGIGGGSVFVALLVGIGHMHLSYAVPISKAMVFCSAFSSFALNRKLERQTAEDVRAVSRAASCLDFLLCEACLWGAREQFSSGNRERPAWVDLLVPLALSGSVVGVLLNTVVPPLFLLVILSLLLLSLSVRTILSAARIHQDERAATVQRPFDEIVLTNASFSSHAPPPLSCASSSSSSRPGFPIDSLSPDRDTRTFVACVSHGSTPPSFPSPRGTTPAERRSATPPEPLALSSGDSLFTDSLSPEGAPRRASGTSPLHGPSRPRQEREEEEQSVSAGEQDSATSADANPAPVSDPPGDEAGDAEIEEGTQLAKQGGQEDGAALTRKEGQGGRVRGSGDFAAVSACDYVVDQGGRMGAGVEASDKGTVEEEVASQRCGSEPTPQKEAPCPFSPSTGSPKAEQILQASWVAKARKILSDTDALCFDTSAQSSPHYFVLSLLLIVNVFSSSVLHLLLGHGMRTRAWAAAVTAVLVGVAVQLRLSILLCRERQAESPLRFPRRPRLSDFHNLSVRFRKRLWRLFCAAGHYAKTAAEATFLWLQVRVDSLPSTTGISGASRSTLLRRRGSSSQQERLASIEIAPVTGWCSRMRQDEGGFPLCPDSAGKPRELREVSREMSNGVGDHIVLLRDPKSYPGHPASVHCGPEGQNVDMRATGSLGLSCSASPLGAWVSLLFLGYESLPPLLLTPLVGFFTGVFAGLVGVGGGVVFSPFLLFMGTDPVSSVATASACVVFTSASTSLQFLLIGRLPLFFGCLFGLVAGSAAAVATCGIHKLRRAVGGQMSIIAGCVAAAVTLASALTVWRCVEVWLQAGEEG